MASTVGFRVTLRSSTLQLSHRLSGLQQHTTSHLRQPVCISRRFASTGSTNPTPPSSHVHLQPRVGKTDINRSKRSWLEIVGTPFRAYGRAQESHPYVVQVFSAMIIWSCGDVLVQYINGSDRITNVNANTTSGEPTQQALMPVPFSETYSPLRTLRSMIIGAISAIPAYRWFIYLGRNFNFKVNATNVFLSTTRRAFLASLGQKVVVNQLVLAPIFNSYFFAMHTLLGSPSFPPKSLDEAAVLAGEAAHRVKDAVPTSLIRGWQFWPIVTAASFTFVPESSRALFSGVAAIGWQTYLGLLNQRAAQRRALAALENAQNLQEQANDTVTAKAGAVVAL